MCAGTPGRLRQPGRRRTLRPTPDSPAAVDTLTIAFSPYADADAHLSTSTEPLEQLLQAKLLEKGYDVKAVDMSVGTSYTAVGEALSAGSADIGFISGGNYVLFSDDCDVLLTALRYAINKDSDDPAKWNDGTIEQNTKDMSTYYRSVFIAGPSAKGQELLSKVNSGAELTWDDLNSATWAVMGPTSASGYIYPSLWLQERYGKTIADLDHAVQSDSYTTSLARLASGQVDVMVAYGSHPHQERPQLAVRLRRHRPHGEADRRHRCHGRHLQRHDRLQQDLRHAMADEAFRQGSWARPSSSWPRPTRARRSSASSARWATTWGSDADYDGERAAQALLKELCRRDNNYFSEPEGVLCISCRSIHTPQSQSRRSVRGAGGRSASPWATASSSRSSARPAPGKPPCSAS